MKGWLVLTCALLMGAATPARAWCEATCLAPAAQGPSHCPSHDPADGTTTVSASGGDECPVVEPAPPTTAARLDFDATLIATYVPVNVACQYLATPFERPHTSTVFERSIPLRI